MKEEQNSSVSDEMLDRAGVIGELVKFNLKIKYTALNSSSWKKCKFKFKKVQLNNKDDIQVILKPQKTGGKVPHDFLFPNKCTEIVYKPGYFRIRYEYIVGKVRHILRLVISYDAYQLPPVDTFFAYEIEHPDEVLLHCNEKLSDHEHPDGNGLHSSDAGGGRNET